MIANKSNYFLFPFLFLFLTNTFSQTTTKNPGYHPFYAGFIAGYGSTTWEGLIPNEQNQSVALAMSTPIAAKEGGSTWGLLAGFEFNPYFAIEGNYTRYPDATIYFDPFSIYSFTHEGAEKFTTETESISLMGKIMVVIPNSNWRVFSSAGVAALYRTDALVEDWRSTPTFSAGINYRFTERIMGELVANYTAGFGESILSPVDTYFPFLYSVTAHLAYRL